jgi:hypothetical protein
VAAMKDLKIRKYSIAGGETDSGKPTDKPNSR